VNCLPLLVITSSGTPCVASAWADARHTARAVARSTTAAITENREWIIDPGDPQLTRDDIDQLDATEDVDAPQLHRPRPLEP
jgi:hypothetical protein